MEKLKMQTTNVVDENIKKIGELFPNCLTETLDEKGRPQTAIDFDQLRQELSKDIVEGPEERYQFTWPDKRNAIRLANAPTTDTLRPCREESVDFDNTQNLYIEGDNLEVLKLLRQNYLGIDGDTREPVTIITEMQTYPDVTLPYEVQVNRHHIDGQRIQIKSEKDSYRDVVLEKKVNSWTWGNILIGGLVGWCIDLITNCVSKPSKPNYYIEKRKE